MQSLLMNWEPSITSLAMKRAAGAALPHRWEAPLRGSASEFRLKMGHDEPRQNASENSYCYY